MKVGEIIDKIFSKYLDCMISVAPDPYLQSWDVRIFADRLDFPKLIEINNELKKYGLEISEIAYDQYVKYADGIKIDTFFIVTVRMRDS